MNIRSTNPTYFLPLSAAFLASMLIGCGSAASGPPEPVFPVSGVITHKGKPVVGADVTFRNQEKKRAGFGRTDEEGRYQLTTFSQNDGAVEGKSVVTVAKYAEAVASAPVADIDSEAYQPPGIGDNTGPAKVSGELPEKYSEGKSSGLFANVLSTGENKFDFELK